MIDVETFAAAKAYTDAHGGEGGTSNYNVLENKPQINGVELSGNKTAEDLGLVASVEGKGLSTNDYTDEDKAIVNSVTDALAEKADTEDIPDLVSDNLAKGILGNETVLSTDTVPFISKLMSEGKYQRKKFVGCSYVWNQLVDSNTESVTIASGHKYALCQNGAWSIGASDGTTIAVTGGSDLFTDLTQLFGSTAIADYIYNLEQATAGAGVAKLKELGFFTEDYYAYDAGSIQSVDIKEYSVTGKNMLDESTLGWYDATGSGGIRYGFKHMKLPAGSYVFNYRDNHGVKWYITNVTNNYSVSSVNSVPFTFTLDEESEIIVRTGLEYGTTIQAIDEPQLEKGSTATAYEPYHKTPYSLTPTELRGVPKIDANNNIYCDGDEYASDGTKTEKYVIADIGTLNLSTSGASTSTMAVFVANIPDIKPAKNSTTTPNLVCADFIGQACNVTWAIGRMTFVSYQGAPLKSIYLMTDPSYTLETFKAAMSGRYLVYEKDTPTTETLTPFDYPQSVGSLEEIVDYKVEQEDRDVAIPTGHVTEYMGKGGEFTLPTLPETPSVLAFDGHNAYWEENTINLVKAFMNENRRTRRNITNDLANLSQAVAEQNLGKYGYSIGDYFTGASGYTYVLADYNTFRGTTSKRISSNHLGIVVDTHATSQWHTGDASAVGYAGSVLHTYLSSTILDTIKSDFIALFGGTTGLEHLVSHSKMLTTALSNIAWQADQYISALSEVQIYGSNVWSANGYQTGEASKKLEVFNKFDYTDIFGNEFIYLRSIESGTLVCLADGNGAANHIAPSNIYYAVGLIIFA